MSLPSNGLVCFTNCLLPREDGSLVEKDLWIDERRGVILDSQKTFYLRRERPDKIVDLGGNILSPGYIDIQINGGFGFDFSVYEGDDHAYRDGLKLVAERITETGVTALVPTIITQEKSLYPKLLRLLRPWTPSAVAAHLLGWHAEGPFLHLAKRGAHAPPLIASAPQGFQSFESTYGTESLAEMEDWLMGSDTDQDPVGVRIITGAPEVEGVMEAISAASKRGICFNIGHSICSTDEASTAVRNGARCITHLFNAMPQLHHRDPSIIGLLGSSPYNFAGPASDFAPLPATRQRSPPGALGASAKNPYASEAFDEIATPLETPVKRQMKQSLTFGQVPFQRPFYEIIVDGIHSHPNSVRLAYSAHPDGCILITDGNVCPFRTQNDQLTSRLAMRILDPHLKDGIHEWRDGRRLFKEGDKLYLEGTTTLAGSVVTMDKCVRNFVKFTGCSLAEAIKCATLNPAKCLGIENKKGSLRAGADADLVVLDRQGMVLSTWVKGKKVWEKN
ncbi:carbohydrate esterase family 9 protein [Chiua virens]|nr:carbohydrate esterase family 9 protein [Chiua virens]